MASSPSTNADTLVTLKINIEGSNRKLKLPLRELGANVLPERLRFLLAIPPSSHVIFERYSDSAAAFVTLDSSNASVYKQLYRAAKAKLKLRLKVTVIDLHNTSEGAHDDATTKQSDLQEYPSPPISPPVTNTIEAAAQNDKSPSLGLAEIQRGFEELLVNCNSIGAGQSPMTSSKATAPTIHVIPVTHGQAARERFFAELAGLDAERQAALRSKCGITIQPSTYSVYCNNCQHPIPDQHYHCSTCDDGDYDLCQACIDSGILCGGDGHWMIKRFVKNGKVINSTTETLPPRKSFSESKATLVPVDQQEQNEEHLEDLRTCNSCIQDLPVENFVTCTSCEDFDLCIPCHVALEHGHHPKHAFTPAVEGAKLSARAELLLKPGRNASHFAICDGCDMSVYGVRHKCLDCPDWDYCSECIVNAPFLHPGHRFAPIYEPLGEAGRACSFPMKVRHVGIYCDGPLCSKGDLGEVARYIEGDRYKCAVCHDTDFCASCEASPANTHNKTHPLIKFKTPVRNVSVTTMGDHDNGHAMPVMGDRRPSTLSRSTETAPQTSANAATQVRTVADLLPTEPKAWESDVTQIVEPVPESKAVSESKPEVKVEPVTQAKPLVEDDLIAHFVRDTVPDGTTLQPNSVFEQTWVMRNDGTTAWPAGCTVKFVGGDNMCAVDPEHPASVHELVSAAESTTCYTEVAPGQEFGFTVLMRTPNRPGKVISYWRLTGPNGNKFGHRLWCDVTVSPPKPESKKEDVAETEEPKITKDAESSQMIFPKLENESPVSSIHQGAPNPVAASTAASELTDDEFESAASFEDDDTEDGFLTDEEYDILDASDEEYLTEQSKDAKN